MIQRLFSASRRLASWHGVWLLWLLLGPGLRLAYGQATAPFTVQVTPAGPLSPATSQVLTATAAYPAFAIGEGFSGGPVNAIVVQDDGKTLVGGGFTTYQGKSANYLVRLNADGSRDESFTLDGTGLNGAVSALALFNGQIIIGGAFTSCGTNNCPYVARLTTTGALDKNFAPAGAGLNGSVAALAVQNSTILVGGSFTKYSTSIRNRIARLTTTGALDKSFRPDSVNSSNPVTAVALQANGGILVGSSSSTVSTYGSSTTITTTPERNYLSRLNTDGTLDAAFAPHYTTPNMYPTYTQVNSIVVRTDTNIIIGGYEYVRSPTYQNSFVRRLGQATGTSNVTQLFAGSGYKQDSRNGDSYPTVTALALQADGKILVGMADQDTYLRRIDAAGVADTTVRGFSASYFGSYAKGQVNALAVQPNGQVLLGGTFTNYNGTTISRLARILPANGSLNTTSVAVSDATYRWSTGATGASLTVSATGTYSATATLPNGASATSNVVAVTVMPFTVRVTPAGTVSLPAKGTQLLTAKAVYPAFAVGAGFNAAVNALVVQPDGKIVVGGDFTSYNGTKCNYLARLNTDASLDTSFVLTKTGSGFNGAINTLLVQQDSKIVVGGAFTTYNGTPLPYVARLKTDGSLDTGFSQTGSGLNGAVYALATQTDGRLIVGGNFTTYNSKAHNYLVRLAVTGVIDDSFAPSLQGRVVALAVQPDDKILVGGDYLVRLNTNGSSDTGYAGISNSVVTAHPTTAHITSLVMQPDGKALVGGYNTYLSGNADCFARRMSLTGVSEISYTIPGTFNGNSTTVALQPDGRILVGTSSFSTTGVFSYLFRFAAAGGLEATLATSSVMGDAGYTRAISVQPNGQVVFGGTFTNYKGTTQNRLARLTANDLLNTTDTDVPNVSYVWSNNSTGPTLTVATSGTYTAKATAMGSSVISNAVVVSVANAPVADFTVRVTPTGSLSLCPSTAQVPNRLTMAALVPNAPAGLRYTWWKVRATGTGADSVGNASTYTYTAPAGSLATIERYFATASLGGAKAASATITFSTIAPPTITSSVSGIPGSRVVLRGTNLRAVTGVSFGKLPAAFVLDSASRLTATVPAGATNGDVSVTTACTTITRANGFSVPAPTIATFTPTSGLPSTSGTPGISGTSVVLAGTGFIAGATTVYFSGPSANSKILAVSTVSSSTELTAIVPAGAASGPLTVTTTGGTATSSKAFTVSPGTRNPTVLRNNDVLLTGTTYNDLIIPASTTVTVRLSSPLGPGASASFVIINNLEVQAGATLNIADTAKVVATSFLLAAGATLNVGHPKGLGYGGAAYSGAPQFSSDANYGYTGTRAQVTGPSLPSQVRSLTSTNSSSLTLTQPVSIAQMLTMAGAGNFLLNGNALTLLSGPDGTALAVAKGTGVVVGQATVQRYIASTLNAGVGYRYLGSPVSGATAAALAAPAFDYDQGRSFVRQDTLPAIEYGFSPAPVPTGSFLAVGRGYRAALPAAAKISFQGTLTTGPQAVTLTRSNAAYGGWNLVSNPYPSPISWDKVIADLDNAALVEGAIYLYQSTGPGTGYYRSYVNGVGTGDQLIAMGQAFFVRMRQPQNSTSTSGQLIFRDNHRAVTYQPQASLNRPASQAAFRVSVTADKNGSSTGGGGCPHCRETTVGIDSTVIGCTKCGNNTVIVYNTPGATAGFDLALDADASNLFSFSQRTLSALDITNRELAVQALPENFAPGEVRTVPLTLNAVLAGEYTIRTQLRRTLPDGIYPYLRDNFANKWVRLDRDSSYVFTLTPTQVLEGSAGRFALQFNANPALATTPLQLAAGLASTMVYPNPAQQQLTIWVPAVPGAKLVHAALLNPLGQVVHQQTAAAAATGTTLHLDVPGLARGVYILRIEAGGATTTRRVVLDQ